MRAGDAAGDDPLPARREFGDDRHIQIAELRQAQASRNGRGGHYQNVRREFAGGGESRPLPDAELVLLINHHDAELGELDIFLNDGLRADDEMRFAAGDVFESFSPLGGQSGSR